MVEASGSRVRNALSSVVQSLSSENPKVSIVESEILETELQYVDFLAKLKELYIAPAKGLLTSEERKILFGNIEDIHQLHIHISHDLKKSSDLGLALEKHKREAKDSKRGINVEEYLDYYPCFREAKKVVSVVLNIEGKRVDTKNLTNLVLTYFICPVNISEVFKKYLHIMRIYQQYVGNYERSMNLLGRIFKSTKSAHKSFRKLIVPLPTQERIEFFLVLPLSRLPRYTLLLKDLRKHLNPGDTDRISDIDQTLKALKVQCRGIQDTLRRNCAP
ncbi:hypothetical protein AAMO2058_001539100 [Amorphochlora amoebiformis]